MPDVKLAWDPKRHDERLPPKQEVTPIECAADDCKGTTFVPIVSLFAVQQGQLKQIGQRTILYKCANCGTDYPLGKQG